VVHKAAPARSGMRVHDETDGHETSSGTQVDSGLVGDQQRGTRFARRHPAAPPTVVVVAGAPIYLSEDG
jgi:hypothetical protein